MCEEPPLHTAAHHTKGHPAGSPVIISQEPKGPSAHRRPTSMPLFTARLTGTARGLTGSPIVQVQPRALTNDSYPVSPRG